MTWRQWRNAGICAAAVLLLTFLFLQQRSIDPRIHDQFVSDVQLVKQLDAEINRDLLNSRYELLGSYDPFVRKLKQMRSTMARLEHIPTYIKGTPKQEIEGLIKRESKLLAE